MSTLENRGVPLCFITGQIMPEQKNDNIRKRGMNHGKEQNEWNAAETGTDK